MTELVYPLQAHNIVLSIAVGLIFGGLVGWKLRFPRGWGGFSIILIIALVSPWLSVYTIVAQIEREWVIHWNIFSVSLFAALAILFIIRLLQRPRELDRPRVTRYL